MKKNEDIETIFSALDGYTQAPPPEIWNQIEARLDEPKRKKKAILWWPVAASLVIGLSVGFHFIFSEKENTPSNTIINTTTPVVTTSDESTIQKQDTSETENKLVQENIINIPKNPAAGVNPAVLTSTKNNSNSINLYNNLSTITNTIISNPIFSDKNTLNENSVVFTKKSIEKEILKDDFNTSTFEKNAIKENQIASQKEINEEIKELENTLASNEEKDKQTTSKELISSPEKWSVGVYAGIAQSGNLSDKKMLGNPISAKQSNAYGVKTNYKLNKKWSVSTGLKLNELGQSVANVAYYGKQSNVSYGVTTNDFFKVNNDVTYLSTNSNYIFSNTPTTTRSNNAQNTPNVEQAANSKTTTTARIDQNLQYLEMPLEISYSVLDSKKANIRLNTGGFMGKLVANEIRLNGESIGENLNVNDFVFGPKLSSTFQYEVIKKTNLFVEPGLNYYVNPINEMTFNQFQWGVNFGINVKF